MSKKDMLLGIAYKASLPLMGFVMFDEGFKYIALYSAAEPIYGEVAVPLVKDSLTNVISGSTSAFLVLSRKFVKEKYVDRI